MNNWVAQGAKRGNPQDAPAPIKFSETGWNFGQPDLVVDFPEPFFVKDEVQDLYENITTQLTDAQQATLRVIRRIQDEAASAANLVYPRPAPLASIRSSLGPNEALVEYALFESSATAANRASS